MTGLRGAALPNANTRRIQLPAPAYVKLPSGFRDQRDFYIEPATNESVQEAIRMYSERVGFAEALARGGRYLQTFQDILVKEGVPPELAYLALVESEFKTDARSWASAFGVWQFMPATGERFGLEQNKWIDERGDPVQSAQAAAKYLRFLYDKFHDWNLAMAAYNAGEGAVGRAIDRHGTSNFWELARRRALPEETRDYVPRIHAAIAIARNPELYGLYVVPEEPLVTDAVPLESPVDLKVAARCLNTDVEGVLDLNPELKRRVTPLDGEFVLKVPAGRGADVQQCLDRLPPNQRVRIHVVERGQTLSSVAHMYKTRPSRLAEVNSLSPKRKLPKGFELVIPLDEEE